MKLYNSLTKEVEELKPQNLPVVTVYTCGPTVYDYPHIGNWFTFIRYDLLIRALIAEAAQPKWVMNITDVGHLTSDADDGEDKLEKGAKREGKTAWDIAEFYSTYFIDGLERLNFLQPSYLERATKHIKEQLDLIKRLEAKGFTYIIDDGVYYDTSKFPKYADFAQLDLDEQQTADRIIVNPQKKNASDFALWKFSPKDHNRDMEWDSPWGKGFPGWHIECSAIAMKFLGETLDIHSGGIDHVPIHHTNEIAQSEAVTGKPLALTWMHTNHVLVEGEKIAKSAGNGITLEDIEAKGYNLMTFRLLVLESHYRTQSKFSWGTLTAAQSRLNNWYGIAVLRWQLTDASIAPQDSTATADIRKPLLDDLNTPQALSNIDDYFSTIADQLVSRITVEGFEARLSEIDGLLGLDLMKQPDISDAHKKLITRRETARAEQDWSKSDELRNELAKQGIGVRDTPGGSIWYRV
ncbi:MAG TPA: cysteine--tRNA ligase [Candidatus Saccharimonadales bacterium]|nr:cysteine--tRNA ligase [Candidatus Saccharimonadales bacterium]